MCLVAQLGHKYGYFYWAVHFLNFNTCSAAPYCAIVQVTISRASKSRGQPGRQGGRKRRGEGKGEGIGEQLIADMWGV